MVTPDHKIADVGLVRADGVFGFRAADELSGELGLADQFLVCRFALAMRYPYLSFELLTCSEITSFIKSKLIQKKKGLTASEKDTE